MNYNNGNNSDKSDNRAIRDNSENRDNSDNRDNSLPKKPHNCIITTLTKLITEFMYS